MLLTGARCSGAASAAGASSAPAAAAAAAAPAARRPRVAAAASSSGPSHAAGAASLAPRAADALADRREARFSLSGAAPARAPPPPPRPELTLGYVADNVALRRATGAYTSRACRAATLAERGLAHASALALANARDLSEVLRWNAAHGVRLFRVSSQMFPWASSYGHDPSRLPDAPAIAAALAEAGALARATRQRLTAHPPQFVKLAARDEALVARSLAELELHSAVFDLMGFAPSLENKINIHVGGVYGSKPRALERFARSVERLSPGARARLAVENDDRPGHYSVADLLPLHAAAGVAVTFDLHHHRFCDGGLSRPEALAAAAATWPAGVRPVVHWSESPEDPARRAARPHAHSAFVFGPLDLHGHEGAVDVMLESKAREAALLLYRDELRPRELAARRAGEGAREAAAAPAAGAEVRLVLGEGRRRAAL
jgi:UV DNA damage endonuclease